MAFSAADGPPRAVHHHLSVIHVILAGIIATIHIALADPFYGWYARIVSALLALIVYGSVVRFVRLRLERLPWIEFLLFDNYVQLGFQIFFPPSRVGLWNTTPPYEAFEAASRLILVSTVSLIVGFALAMRVFRLRVDGLIPQITDRQVTYALPGYLVLTALYTWLRLRGPHLTIHYATMATEAVGIPTVVNQPLSQVLAPLTATVIALVAYHSRPSLLRLAAIVTGFAIVLYEFYRTSLMGPVAMTAAMVIVFWWHGQRKFPTWFAVAMLIGLSVFEGRKGHFRDVAWGEDARTQAFDAWTEAFSKNNAQPLDSDNKTNPLQKRLNEFSSVAHTVYLVPVVVPYGEGLSYRGILLGMIPRVLWPDKPNITAIGLDEVGIRLGLTTLAASRYSTVGITAIAHAYAEHGVPGAMVVMALIGLAVGGIAGLFSKGLGGAAAGGAIFLPFARACSSGMVAVLGSVWQTIVYGILVILLIRLLALPFHVRRPSRLLTGRAKAPNS